MTTPLTAEKIAELERLLAAATPDWRLARNGVVTGGPFHEYARGSAQSQTAMFCHMADNESWQESNAALAVAMHEALPQLLSLAKRVAGAPVGRIRDEGDHWELIARDGDSFVEIGKMDGCIVRLVEIVGGEEGNG
jgi:hypothetical protein